MLARRDKPLGMAVYIGEGRAELMRHGGEEVTLSGGQFALPFERTGQNPGLHR